MFGYIYKTTNLVNNKLYIGQKQSNKFLGDKYLGSGFYLKKAIVKYGKDNFKVDLLCECSSKIELDEKEKYYIKKLNTTNRKIGYNIATGGEGNNGGQFKGHKHSEEYKKKMSEFMKNWMSKNRKGKTLMEIFGKDWLTGKKYREGKPSPLKGTIKIYNKELDKEIYIKKEDDLKNYPGYEKISRRKYIKLNKCPKNQDEKPNYKYSRNTHFMYKEGECKCRRIKDIEVNKYLEKGWKLGRKFNK